MIRSPTAECRSDAECVWLSHSVANADDAVLGALDDVVEALLHTRDRIDLCVSQASAARTARQSGRSWSEIVERSSDALIVTMLSDSLAELRTTGSQLRRLKAATLWREGMKVERIANLFGVTHQRVSALVRRGLDPEGQQGSVGGS